MSIDVESKTFDLAERLSSLEKDFEAYKRSNDKSNEAAARLLDKMVTLSMDATRVSTSNSAAIKEINKSFDRVYKLTFAVLAVAGFGVLSWIFGMILKDMPEIIKVFGL